MEVEDYNLPWTARERVVLDTIKKHLGKAEGIKVEVSEFRRYQISASCLSQKIRGMKQAFASSCCSTHLEAKEQVEVLKWLMQCVLPKQQRK